MNLLMVVLSVVDRVSQRLYMRLATRLLVYRGGNIDRDVLWISPKAYIDLGFPGAVSIGARSVISHFVQVLTHDFSVDRSAERAGLTSRTVECFERAPVSIGAYCFIGMGAIIMPGVSVGDGSVVGAHAVVTRDVEPGSVVVGNPARVISTVDEFLAKRWPLQQTSLRRK